MTKKLNVMQRAHNEREQWMRNVAEATADMTDEQREKWCADIDSIAGVITTHE